jgi:formylglycine-generating enzyme required for sulfatase activity
MFMKHTRFLLVMSAMVSLLALSPGCSKKEREGVVNRGETEKIAPSPKGEETEKTTSLPSKSTFPPLKIFQFETVTIDAKGKVTNRRTLPAQSYTEVLGGGVQLEMVEIPAGTFKMGSSESDVKAALTDIRRYNPNIESGKFESETPQHQVTVSEFYIGKYLVTQAQYRAVIGTNPSNFEGANLPVENVSWDDATQFCRKLSQMTGREYRLPSEAEWEYSARAGTQTPFAFGETITLEIVNYEKDYPYGGAAKGTIHRTTTAVGSLGVTNGFGLYDMHGNVWEWCQDWYHENYNGAPVDGSAWENGGEQQDRVMRGGAWNEAAVACRSAFRNSTAPGIHAGGNIGFRVVAIART